MKKDVLRIARRYRKSFTRLASKYPKQAMKYWFNFNARTDGLLDLLAEDSSLSSAEYMLICDYLATQWQRLFNIYCK